MDQDRAVIAADKLTKTYGDLRAVDGISFRVEPGECFGVLGPNGAGKTTTVRMIYGYLPRTSGSLRVFGLDVAVERRAVAARVGVCQQENNLDPDLSVEQNLRVFARYFDLPRDRIGPRVDELLEFVALGHRRHDNVQSLSGGLMRRLVIARALLHQPDLLVLDEPTVGLDPQSRHQVWGRLEELRKNGLTILLTTHYMDEAARLCDRLLIVDRGKILVEGPPGALIREHVGRHVIEVGGPDENARRLVAERGLDVEDLGHRLLVYADEGEITFREMTEGICRGGCVMRMATLEDVFLRLTGRELRE